MALPRVAFLPSHPAQLWLLRPVADAVAGFADVRWLLRDKDLTVQLADQFGIRYRLLTQAARGVLGNAVEFGRAAAKCVKFAREDRIDAWITKYGPGHVAARLTGARSLAFNDDDADIVPLIAWTAYPLSTATLVTHVTRMGRFASKAVRFTGFFELCYLHPVRFQPDASIYDDLGLSPGSRFAVVRMSSLESHHDVHARGMTSDLLRHVVARVGSDVRVFVTCEKPLEAEFESLRFPIAPSRIHHALAHADFFLGDSQTMTSEAAVLGTPAFRLSSFVGKLSYLDDLERRGLAFGYLPGQEDALFADLERLLGNPAWREEHATRRQRMLEETIDPVPWIADAVRLVLDGAGPEDLRRGLRVADG